MAKETTQPCEYCGTAVTKTATQQSQRKYWTCNRSCANKLRIQRGNTPSWAPNPLRGVKETRPCAQCGEPVTRYLSARRNAQVWTCSNQCQGTYNTARRMAAGLWVQPPPKPRRGETTLCLQCQAPVYRQRAERAKGVGRYCSRACKALALSKPPVVKTCARCGVEMRLKPSQAYRVYCSKLCDGLGRTKRPGDRLHNGKPIRYDRQGYVMVWAPDHPNKAFHGWQYEHRMVAEQTVGRILTRDEHVHHLNGIKHDNRPENLEVMDGLEHAALSARDYRDHVQQGLSELEEYRRRYGPLEDRD